MLVESKSGGPTEMSGAVEQLLNQRRPAGVAIVISDFLVPAPLYKTAFSHLLAAHYEIKADPGAWGSARRPEVWAPGRTGCAIVKAARFAR